MQILFAGLIVAFAPLLASAAPFSAPAAPLVAAAPAASYIGSKACEQCHEQEYQSFIGAAKMARSGEKLFKRKELLTEDEFSACLSCHTTGYRKPGGFISMERTPHLANTGCESCHGPGSRHADTLLAKDIRRAVEAKTCLACHQWKRMDGSAFTPFRFGGVH